jgi:hypothetical protein
MAKAPTQTVDQFLAQLEHPLKAEIQEVRQIVLGAIPGVTERVKWNAPSFCFNGDDRVTMRLQPGNRLGVIFHRGVKVKDATNFAFADPTGLMVWQAKDRATVSLKTMEDVNAHRAALAELVARWMEATA